MNKKPRILFLIPDFPRISETFIVNQMVYLLDRGYDIAILSWGTLKHPPHPKVIQYDLLAKTTYVNIPDSALKRLACFIKTCIRNPSRNHIRALNIFRFKIDALKLKVFYKLLAFNRLGSDFDIVHAHFGFMSDFFFKGKYLGFFEKSKLITTFHGYDMMPNELALNRKRYKELFANNTLITVNNDFGKSLILNINPHYRRIKLLPVGLDTQYYKPSKAKTIAEFTNVLFCGRLIPLKGCDILIKIAHILINDRQIKSLRFHIVGNGKELGNLKKLVNKYNLENHITFSGFKTQEQIIRIMEESDLFLLPGIVDDDGRAETQGLVIQEAQAMCLPVIVSDAGGMKYGVENGINGFVVPERDEEGFADKIELLVHNTDLRKKMGEAARNFVVDNFDSKVLGEKLEKYYCEVLAG
ncbi:glycosyltransferase [Parapedobacter sp. GCM10030251]|uniref:glycosyltransferase n=1 Tax=Parapedobacter sp. GCM10030251 TaxID=3273419 RepID=UPI00361F0253